MKKLRYTVLLFWLWVSVAGILVAQPIPYSLDSKLTTNPHVKKGTLENGLTYYIRKNSVPENKVELRLVINAGSILETDSQQGLAHFLEHLSFKKTKTFPEGDMIKQLENVGVRFGYELNAFTSFEETVYYLPIIVTEIDLGLRILKDWAFQLSLTDEEIDIERGVILEELRLGSNAGKRVREQYLPVLFKGSLYPYRMPIGKAEVLENFKYEELRSFYHDWHRPELISITAVGNINPEEVENKIKVLFSDIPKSSFGVKPRPETIVPDHEQIKAIVATDPETRGCSVEISYKHKPKKSVTQRDYIENQIYNALYTSMINSRLSELIESMDEPPFSEAESGYSSYFRGVDTYSSYARSTPKDVARALEVLVAENERVLRYGFTETELDRAKTKLLRRYERYYNERDRTASDLHADEYQVNFLTGQSMPGIEFEYGLLQTVLPQIHKEDISHLASRYMTEKNRVVVVTGPKKDDITYPSEQELIAIVENVKAKNIEPYDDGKVVTQLMSFTPKSGKIVKESYIKDTDMIEWTLSNGAKVVIKKTDFKNDEILFRSTSNGGFSMFDEKDDMSALYATRIQDKSGVNGINNTQLMRLMAGKTIAITQSLVLYNESMSGRFAPGDATDFFQLVYLYHTAPMFDPAAFEKIMKQEKSDYKDILSTPNNYFDYQINETINNGNPRRNRWPIAENLEKVNFERACEIYKARFGNAAGFTFVFVGNIDIDKLKPLVLTYIAGLPGNPKTKTGYAEQNFSSPKQHATYIYKKGDEPNKAKVSLRFFKAAPWDKEKAFQYQQFVDILNTRIFESLRLEMGGIYGASVIGRVNQAHEQEASLNITFGTNADAYRKLTDRAIYELKKLLAEGPTQEEVDRVKEKLRVAKDAAMKQNARWLVDMMNAYRYGVKVDNEQERTKEIETITTANIREAGAGYIDPDNYLEFILLPE